MDYASAFIKLYSMPVPIHVREGPVEEELFRVWCCCCSQFASQYHHLARL